MVLVDYLMSVQSGKEMRIISQRFEVKGTNKLIESMKHRFSCFGSGNKICAFRLCFMSSFIKPMYSFSRHGEIRVRILETFMQKP